eukprot:5661596-Amphidinium_carterae.1
MYKANFPGSPPPGLPQPAPLVTPMGPPISQGPVAPPVAVPSGSLQEPRKEPHSCMAVPSGHTPNMDLLEVMNAVGANPGTEALGSARCAVTRYALLACCTQLMKMVHQFWCVHTIPDFLVLQSHLLQRGGKSRHDEPGGPNFNNEGLASHLFPPAGNSDFSPPRKDPPSEPPPPGSPPSGDPGDPYNEFTPNMVPSTPNDQLNKHRMELPV